VHELYNPLTLENLRNALTESRIEPVWLGLEITERVAMKQMETINRILETVSQWGMPILLDDFGTGYSSLSLLQTLPVDVVKIDKSFIQSMLTDPRSAALVRTIIRMCHELGKTVMAEGIESRSQLKHLQKLGCDYGQGFLFGKPSPPAAFSKNPYRYRCMAEYGN
jgi:EAL domain-containing protein (putative c-di-GMP-specific phosphodiesterase class I)